MSKLPTRTLASELPRVPPGTPVVLQGWVHRRRVLASVAFLVLRDRSGTAQVVVRSAAARAALEGLPEETVVSVTGVASANPQAPGGVEVTEPAIAPLTDPAEAPPVERWRPTLDASLPTLLDSSPVLWRHPTVRARGELTAAALEGFRSGLSTLGFTEIRTPKLVGNVSESGANVFPVDYFGRPAYLAQSPQLYKQQMVGVFERVYEVGPVFRAEPHDTVRHLAEYTSLDVELGFVRDHRDVLAVLVEVLRGMVGAMSSRGRALELTGASLPEVPAEVPVLHFREALRICGAPADEPDLSPAMERHLGEWAVREHGSDLLAVEGYPMAKRPFYTMPSADPRWSNSFDLLFRGTELVTGGQRLHRHGDYVRALVERGEDPAAYAGYLQAFAHGMPPHGGFAIGLERWMARVLRLANVRETTPYPRDLHRLTP